ncbi:tyrosine-type recombinase/integrase [Streptomyces microflavus]|uniref:tyrosine-type recombinase/integrase n=1 Tax=Streptomyces microflavus TaxID=1919 RepID=UPI0034348537
MARRNANGEGSIYQRKNGRWVGSISVQTTGGKRKRVYCYGRTRAEASRELTKLKAQNDQGTPTADKNWLLGEYLDYWLEEIVKPNRRPATHAQCETIVRLYLKPGIGDIGLHRLSVSRVQRYINHLLAENHSISKTHVIRKVLSAALIRAEREELINRNVARLVELPPEERKEIKPWSLGEVTEFLKVVTAHRLYAAYLMLFYGLRKGELLGLRWQDIDVANSKIHVRQQLHRVGREILIGPLKTSKSRRDLPLLDPVKHALAAYYETLATKGSELVFTTPDGKPIDPGNFLRDFKKVCRDNGFRIISVHTIRHTVATLLKSRRVPDRDIQLILGHSRIVTTQEVYQHDDDDSRRAALQGLTSALLEPFSTNAVQDVPPGLPSNVIDSNSRCQNGCQKLSFLERLTAIISGGAYRIRTDDLFHAMTIHEGVEARATEVDRLLKDSRRRWLIGVVAVSVAVKTTQSNDIDLAA